MTLGSAYQPWCSGDPDQAIFTLLKGFFKILISLFLFIHHPKLETETGLPSCCGGGEGTKGNGFVCNVSLPCSSVHEYSSNAFIRDQYLDLGISYC